MIKREKITTIDQIKNLIFDLDINKDNGRYRSSYIWRGMSDVDFKLKTSLMRNCKNRASQLEQHILDNFCKYVSIEDPSINDSIWKAMIIGQHHGLPTRLLDWTHSSLVALHFATSEGNMELLGSKDTILWKIDSREINTNLPSKYQEALNEKKTFVFSVDYLSTIVNDISQYDKDMGDKSMVIVEPPSIDQRIANQYSFFTVIPKGITDIENFLNKYTKNSVQYIIDSKLNWQIRDILDQLNITERMIYPGKDGIARWIARHYFVKEENK